MQCDFFLVKLQIPIFSTYFQIFSRTFQLMTILSTLSNMELETLSIDTENPTSYVQLCRRAFLLVTLVIWVQTTWSKTNELKTFLSLHLNYKASYDSSPEKRRNVGDVIEKTNKNLLKSELNQSTFVFISFLIRRPSPASS